MAHIVGDLAKYFQFDEINIDNWHFKLYYKVNNRTNEKKMTTSLSYMNKAQPKPWAILTKGGNTA